MKSVVLFSAFAMASAAGAVSVQVHEDPVVRRALRPFVASGELPMGVSVFEKGGKVRFECFGGVGTNDVFWVASMTKGVTAAAVLTLVDRGMLALEDRVSDFLPEFRTVEKRTITVRQLLCHTSGLPGDTAKLDRRVRAGVDSLDEVVRRVASVRLVADPDEAFDYCSVGFDVVGAVVEAVAGMPFDRYLRETFFVPLGMNDTTFVCDRERLVPLWEVADGKRAVEVWRAPWTRRFPSGGGGLFSTPHDMWRFYRMLMKGGRLDGRVYLSTRSMCELMRRQTPKGVGPAYSLGMHVYENGWIGHFGMRQTYVYLKPVGRELRMFFGQFTGMRKGAWYAAWEQACEIEADPLPLAGSFRRDAKLAIAAGAFDEAVDLSIAAAELDGDEAASFRRIAEAYEKAVDGASKQGGAAK